MPGCLLQVLLNVFPSLGLGDLYCFAEFKDSGDLILRSLGVPMLWRNALKCSNGVGWCICGRFALGHRTERNLD